jgi:hypothetical protein
LFLVSSLINAAKSGIVAETVTIAESSCLQILRRRNESQGQTDLGKLAGSPDKYVS